MGIHDPNPNFWQALLRLAEQGKFRGQAVPCFFGGALPVCADRVMARSGRCAVFDLPPNAHDRFGIWENAVEEVDADYYITEDGESGRLVDLAREGAPYALFYAHWQGLNPANGVGWEAFTRVVRRVQRHLGDQVEWVRPSELAERLLKN